MLGNSINTSNLLQSSISDKKLVKPQKKFFFGRNLHKKGVIIGHAQNGEKFFSRNNKSRSSAFRNFLFYQNICFDWVMNLFDVFCQVSFPAKTAVTCPNILIALLPRVIQFLTDFFFAMSHYFSCGWIISPVETSLGWTGGIPPSDVFAACLFPRFQQHITG